MDPPNASPLGSSRAARWRRALLWTVLLLLLGVAQSLLVWLTARHESSRAQDVTEAVASEVAGELRRELMRLSQLMQGVAFSATAGDGAQAGDWVAEAGELLRQRHELRRIERRDLALATVAAQDSPFNAPLFRQLPRADVALQAELACATAQRASAPTYSRSYFVPLGAGLGLEVMDLCLPLTQGGQITGFLVGSVALAPLLDAVMATQPDRQHEFSLVEGDGTRLARAGSTRGLGVFRAERVVDLPGTTLQLRADSARGTPSLIPNLATALVLGLSIALFALVLLLARDVRRRAQAEAALAEALAFRKAMEDSLVTGLRARDLAGVITYVNPAFCAMVGFTPEELRAPVPPYWPPEYLARYQERQRQRLGEEVRTGRPAEDGAPRVDSPFVREAREGFETVFMRRNGERFPVMIYEAPLVDGQGRHTGWMSAVLDVSAQRRVEEISRQQQDRLQATARLTTVGEMASLLSHELNQPLAAIASYASGSVNLLDSAAADPQALPEAELRPMLRQALSRIAEQAERAGRIIKSVHDFVRRREHQHEVVPVDVLLEAVLPLVRLQARKSGTRVEVELPPGPQMPRVRCDRTLMEQVLLNLTRNGIQAMETAATPLEARVLTLRVQQPHAQWVSFAVIDAGPGIAPEVAQRLFQPFFTTRAEGMGLGLSLCRTVVEQHGGALDFGPGPWREGQPRGTEFRFTLPTPRSPGGARHAGVAGAAPRPVTRESGDTSCPDPVPASVHDSALHPPR